jgi:4-amino-4-deoxy-L-arabinose transferase-like glycosyltransferase
VLRTVSIIDNPPGFSTDEAAVGYNAYSILTTGKDEHGETLPVLFRSFGDYKLPVFVYSQVPAIAALGLSELPVRLTAAFYGVLTVASTYVFVYVLFRQKALALAAAFFLAISPWHIHYSRTGFGELVCFPFFLTAGLTLLLLGMRRNSLWLAAAMVLGLTLYTYRAAWTAVPLLVGIIGVLYWRDVLRGWRTAAVSVAIMAAMATPIAVHALAGESDRSDQVSILQLDLGVWGTLERFADHYRTYFSWSFLFADGDNSTVLRHYLPGFGELYYVQLPFIVIGVLALLWRPTREKLVVLAMLAVYPLGGALTAQSPFSSRAILGSVVFAIVTAYGVIVTCKVVARVAERWTSQRWRVDRLAAGALAAAVLAASLGSLGWYLHEYYESYPNVAAGASGWQYGTREVVTEFVRSEGQYDELIMEPIAFAPTAIFFDFYAPNDCEKCRLGDIDDYDPSKRQLFALTPGRMASLSEYRHRTVIDCPNGQPAYYLVELTGSPLHQVLPPQNPPASC